MKRLTSAQKFLNIMGVFMIQIVCMNLEKMQTNCARKKWEGTAGKGKGKMGRLTKYKEDVEDKDRTTPKTRRPPYMLFFKKE